MKKYNILLEDNKFEGTAKEIIEFVKTKSFIDKSHLTLEEWIKEVQGNVWRLYGIGTNVDNTLQIEKRCELLVDQMIQKGLIKEDK